jgi:hypothetical protein
MSRGLMVLRIFVRNGFYVQLLDAANTVIAGGARQLQEG